MKRSKLSQAELELLGEFLSRLGDPPPAMPEEFQSLASYNAERARGVMHTQEWVKKMAQLQTEYDVWAGKARTG